MQLSDSRLSSANSNSPVLKLTIIEDKVLLIRLTAELSRVHDELRWAAHEFWTNPAEFLRSFFLKSCTLTRRQLTSANVFGFTSAVFVIVLSVLLVLTIDRKHKTPEAVTDVEEIPKPEMVILVVTPSTGPFSIYPAATGRVGLRQGRGEGSASDQKSARGGGSGGDDDLFPAQQGKIPQFSAIPAVIPKQPPTNPSSLPAAGVDIDPLLWRDIKYPKFGDPHSRSIIPSNGEGQNGGMGNNEGLGVGDGRGNGFGSGNNGNTGGDGERQIGGNGVGGGPAGAGFGRSSTFRSSEVEQKARLLSKPEPQYSEEARKQGITGTVVLRVIFSSTGEITQIRAVQTLPFGLTERAIAAAREIKFLPAMKGGRPVSVYMQLEYNFNLY
jgi:TonB family protein